MKDYNEDYFLLYAGGVNFPALTFIGPNQTSNMFKFFKDIAIDDQMVILVGFADPVPRNPKMADAHSMASNNVISSRIKYVLEGFQLKNVQFVPALVHDQYEEHIENGHYHIPHIYNLIRCVDTAKSTYRDKSKHADIPVYDIKKLVLDNRVLDKIPLEERLVFGLREQRSRRVYHRSVVEKILELEPTGVAFYQLSTYHEGKPFQTGFLDYILNSED